MTPTLFHISMTGPAAAAAVGADLSLAAIAALGLPLVCLALAGVSRRARQRTRQRASQGAPQRNSPRDDVALISMGNSSIAKVLAARDLDSFFRLNSRSFWFASLWFTRRQRRTVRRVYAFCRATDDIVDRAPNRKEAGVALAEWRRLALLSYRGRATSIRWLDDLMAETRSAGVPFSLIDDLMAGVKSDLNRVRVADWNELSLYCYRVGSVVGLWMCRLYGVADVAVLDRARALGHAMQLTNIARDVGEDLRLDRVYIPHELRDAYLLSESDLRAMQVDGVIRDAYSDMMRDLIGRANQLYDFASAGIPALPSGFRSAVAVASRVYRGIHDEIATNNYDNLNRRASTSLWRKLKLAVGALLWLRSTESDLVPHPTGAYPDASVEAPRLEVAES